MMLSRDAAGFGGVPRTIAPFAGMLLASALHGYVF